MLCSVLNMKHLETAGPKDLHKVSEVAADLRLRPDPPGRPEGDQRRGRVVPPASREAAGPAQLQTMAKVVGERRCSKTRSSPNLNPSAFRRATSGSRSGTKESCSGSTRTSAAGRGS